MWHRTAVVSSMQTDNVSTTSKEQNRKNSKPVMEKRRRARINASLSELKSLLLDVIKNEGTRNSKMEKADILEMTVKHLRQIQKQHFSPSPSSSSPTSFSSRSTSPGTFQSGFMECTAEVRHYIETVPDMKSEIRSHLLDHLSTCLNRISPQNTESFSPALTHSNVQLTDTSTINFSLLNNPRKPSMSTEIRPQLLMTQQYSSLTMPHEPTAPHSSFSLSTSAIPKNDKSIEIQSNAFPLTSSLPQDTIRLQSQTPTNIFSGLQVLPTKLPGGELLFIVPSNPITPGQVPNYIIPVYTNQQQSSSIHNTSKTLYNINQDSVLTTAADVSKPIVVFTPQTPPYQPNIIETSSTSAISHNFLHARTMPSQIIFNDGSKFKNPACEVETKPRLSSPYNRKPLELKGNIKTRNSFKPICSSHLISQQTEQYLSTSAAASTSGIIKNEGKEHASGKRSTHKSNVSTSIIPPKITEKYTLRTLSEVKDHTLPFVSSLALESVQFFNTLSNVQEEQISSDCDNTVSTSSLISGNDQHMEKSASSTSQDSEANVWRPW